MPTPYADLNAVIAELVSGAREILGENFCGAYLQGSFAVGHADEHSDVDFLIVTHDEVTDKELAGLEAMHQRMGSRRAGRRVNRPDPARPGRPPDPWLRVYQSAEPEAAARTLAFADYAVVEAATRYPETRSAAR